MERVNTAPCPPPPTVLSQEALRQNVITECALRGEAAAALFAPRSHFCRTFSSDFIIRERSRGECPRVMMIQWKLKFVSRAAPTPSASSCYVSPSERSWTRTAGFVQPQVLPLPRLAAPNLSTGLPDTDSSLAPVMDVFKSRLLGISVAVAHGVFSGSLNILLKFLISNYHFGFLTLIQFLTSSTAMVTLETLRRLGKVEIPPFSLQLAKVTSVTGSLQKVSLFTLFI